MKNKTMVVIGSLFAISGICGLVYEIVWAKYLSLFIGNTTYAQTIVLASFMGGLMLGSYVIGRYADRTNQQLRLYALIEIAIGAYCLAFPFVLRFFESLYLSVATSLDFGTASPAIVALKLLLSLFTMIVPTFLMGGTLPVLVKFVTRTIDEAGKDVATLYWINSFGAIVGAGLAGFFLIRELGLSSTVMVAAFTNMLVGLLAFGLSRLQWWMPGSLPEVEGASRIREVAPKTIIRLSLLTAAVSGFVSMIYELAWARLLSPILGSSTYSFSLMLVAFIAGITAGSLLVSRFIHRVGTPLKFLVVCQIGSGLSMILALPLYERLPYYFWQMAAMFPKTPEGFAYFLGAQLLFCFMIMVVPTVFLGMSLPTVSRIASIRLTVLGRTIGNVFAINTLGAVLGATVTGLVLIPAIGVRQSIEAGILLNILVGYMILFSYKGRSRGIMALVLVPTIVFLGYKLFVPAWDPKVLTAGVFQRFDQEAPASFEDFEQRYRSRQILYYQEGIHANVAVDLSRGPGGMEKSLIINGKFDASTVVDLPTQVCVAQVPLLVGPDSGSVLVIGLGSGITVGSVLTHPVRSVDCVEISPEVVEASRFFTAENGNCLGDLRVQLHLEDAHSFLKLTPRVYDVIISEPSNPWIAGIGNLFSREYFEECNRKLRKSGLMAQWLQTYDMDNEVFQIVLRTFTSVFDNVVMLRPTAGDVLLLGSRFPVRVDFSDLQRKMQIPRVKGDLERIYVADIPTLLSLQMTTEQTMRSLGGQGPLNTEDKPLLEYLAPRGLFIGSEVALLKECDERGESSSTGLWIHDYVDERPLTPEQCVNIALYQMNWTTANYGLASHFLDRASILAPGDPNVEGLKAELTRIVRKN